MLEGCRHSAPSQAMAIPMVRAARALAEDYRMQARQIQTLSDSNCTILALGFTDREQNCCHLPKHLLRAHQELVCSLVKAATACQDMGDMLDNWASDIESAVVETVALTSERDSRRPRPY